MIRYMLLGVLFSLIVVIVIFLYDQGPDPISKKDNYHYYRVRNQYGSISVARSTSIKYTAGDSVWINGSNDINSNPVSSYNVKASIVGYIPR